MDVLWSAGRDLGIGLFTAVAAVVLMQNVPVGLRLSLDVAIWQRHDHTRIYRAELRRRWWLRRSFKGPVDVNFHGRFVHTTARGTEQILEVPIAKDWRPAIGRQVQCKFMVDDCAQDEVKHFLGMLNRSEAELPENVDDLFELSENGQLRLYVFGYHRRTGTRWTLHQTYHRAQVISGKFDKAARHVIPEDEPPMLENT